MILVLESVNYTKEIKNPFGCILIPQIMIFIIDEI